MSKLYPSNGSTSSRRESLLPYGAAALVLLVLGLSLWYVFIRIDNEAHKTSRNHLGVVLNSTHQATRNWFLHKKASASRLAESTEIIRFTKELLSAGSARSRLLQAPAQSGLRSLLNPVIQEEKYLGFVVIGADGINLAADKDQNVGALNRSVGRNGYLESLKSAMGVVSLPMFPDVLSSDANGELLKERPLMFAGAALRDDAGNAIASLVFQIDPQAEFTGIMRNGRIGLSGETYAFDRKARLITESRFNDRLSDIGLISPGTNSTLKVRMLDPGVNLTAGERTTVPPSEQPLTLMAEQALAGKSGVNVNGYRDYRGVPVIGAWVWDPDFNFGLTTEIDVSEAYRPIHAVRRYLAAAAMISAIMITGLAFVFVWGRRKATTYEKKLDALVANSSDIITVVDQNGIIQYVSPSITTVLGYDPEEFSGRPAFDFVHPDDLSVAVESLAGIAEIPNGSVVTEFRFRHKDGGWRNIEGIGRNLLHDPAVAGVVVNSRDISERKRAEEELRKYEQIATSTRTLISFIDLDYKYQVINPPYLEAFGCSRENIIGRTQSEFFGHEQFEGSVRAEADRCFSGESINNQIWVEFPGWGRRFMDRSFEPVRDAGGSVIGGAIISRDITDLRLAEERLEQVAAERNLILENARITINLAKGRRVVRADAAFEKMAGWNIEDLPDGLDMRELYAHQKDFDRVGREVGPALAKGLPYEFETLMKRKDGSTFWCRSIGNAVDPDDPSQGILWLGEDITDRRETEERLRESEERSRMALSAANAGSWSWRIGTNHANWSDEFYEVLGYEKDFVEPEWDRWFGRVHPEDKDCVAREVKGALSESNSLDIEFRLVRVDGEIRWMNLIGRVSLDDYGNPETMYGLQVDITERKKNEELSTRFGRIVEETLNEIYIFDSESLKFLQVNRGARENLGYSAGELENLTPVDIKPEFTREKLENVLRPLRDGTEQRANIETLHERKDGSTYDVQINLQYVRTENPPVFAAIVQDVTKSKLIEQELRQAQKMEAVGQLTGGVAHDFNNLLGIILGSVELVSEELVQDDPKLRLLERAIRAVDRGQNLTGRLLAFSRKQTLQPQVINANGFVTNTAEILRRTIPESIEIRTDLDVALWTVEIDPSQLEDALLNLSINARDAMEDGGTLTIRTRNESHEEDTHPGNLEAKSGDFVVLSVTDTGGGMSAEILDRVFEPFFTTKEVGKGTGLGLSMVYGFAKQSGGHVSIDSEEGTGTTVSVCLPGGNRPVIAETSPESNEVPKGGSEVILVVEDDPDVRAVMASMLETLGYAVLRASDGAEGLATLKGAPHVDMLISDLVMPGGMNGVDLVAKAREIRPDLNCLFMSGYTALSDGSLPEDIELLNKPIRLKELARSVRNVLDTRALPLELE